MSPISNTAPAANTANAADAAVPLRGLFIGPPVHPGVYAHAMLIGVVFFVAGYAAFLSAESAALERT